MTVIARENIEELLSKPESKTGRTQRAVLALLLEHEAEGGIPTNGRFVFYELEQRGDARKPSPDDQRKNRRRSNGWPPGQQDVTDALTALRDRGLIPWSWIVDEERRLFQWAYAASVADYMLDRLDEATISPWGAAPPPLILCESKATAGVLAGVLSAYCCPIAGTKGQARGFLETEIADLLRRDDERPALYLGDLDFSGAQIEANTRSVLEHAIGCDLDWTRLGMTQEQVDAFGIEPIWKVDGRNGHGHEAVEVESLGQANLVDLVRSQLDALLPEPLRDVQERERVQRARVSELFEEVDL